MCGNRQHLSRLSFNIDGNNSFCTLILTFPVMCIIKEATRASNDSSLQLFVRKRSERVPKVSEWTRWRRQGDAVGGANVTFAQWGPTIAPPWHACFTLTNEMRKKAEYAQTTNTHALNAQKHLWSKQAECSSAFSLYHHTGVSGWPANSVALRSQQTQKCSTLHPRICVRVQLSALMGCNGPDVSSKIIKINT